MPRGNTTLHLTSIKLFYKTNKLIEAKSPKPEYSSKDICEDIIIINTTNNPIPARPLTRGRGRPRKNPNITLFLQDDL